MYMVNRTLFVVYHVANKKSKDCEGSTLVKVHCYVTLSFNYTFKYHCSNTYWYQFNYCEYIHTLRETHSKRYICVRSHSPYI